MVKKIKRIYWDTASATPLNPRVARVMQNFYATDFGNPASIHTEGVVAEEVLEKARKDVAEILAAHGDEIIFTSGGTEGNNLALKGVVAAWKNNHKTKPHFITTAIEHSSVLEPLRALKQLGGELTILPVNKDGLVNPKDLAQALKKNTVLVSVMYANNEIGTIQPLREMAKVIRDWRKKQKTVYPYFHTDACQAPRFLPLGVPQLGVDLLTLNGAKIYGPKGSGCLYVKRGVNIEPLVHGGGQEAGRRSGTPNVAGIVGFSEALKICASHREKESKKLSKLRDLFIKKVINQIPSASLNGTATERLPNNANILFPKLSAEELVLRLDAKGVAVSAGSACSARSLDESYVIMALGKTKLQAESSVRFTLPRNVTVSDTNYVVTILKQIVNLYS